MIKRSIPVLLFVIIGFHMFGQMSYDTLSKIEKFYARKGKTIETKFNYIGKISDMELYVTKMYDHNGNDSISGLRMSIKVIDNLMSEYYENVIIDVREVDELIGFIEKVSSTIATNQQTMMLEYHYLSKSQFLCYVANVIKKGVVDWKVRLNVDNRRTASLVECSTAELLSFLKLLKISRVQLF